MWTWIAVVVSVAFFAYLGMAIAHVAQLTKEREEGEAWEKARAMERGLR